MGGHGAGDQVVELPCADPLVTLLVHRQHLVQDAIDALPGEGGDEEGGHPGHEVQLAGDGVLEAHGVGVPLDQVPLVDHQDAALPFALDLPGDVLILGGEQLRGVHHQQHHVRPSDGAGGAQDAVLLDPRLDPSPAPDPGGVDQHEAPPAVLQLGVDGVAGGAGDLAHHHPLLAQEPVQQEDLPTLGRPTMATLIRSSSSGSSSTGGAELGHDLVQEVAGVGPVVGGDGDDGVEAQAVELVGHLAPVGVVRLAHRHDHRLR